MTARFHNRFVWLGLVAAVVLVVVAAYLLGRSSGGLDSRAGGEASVSQRAPSCSRSMAERAIVSSGFDEAVRSYAVAQASLAEYRPANVDFFTDVPTDYQVALLHCRDVTGDGRDEMIVGLGAGASQRVSQWAVFTSDDSAHWRLAFERQGSLVSSIGTRDHGLVVQTPTYGADDALCCPSGFKSTRIVVGRGGFDVAPSRVPVPQRTIVLADGRVTQLGPLDPLRDSALQALAEFGSPTSVGSSYESSCPYEWSDLGLSIAFANFGAGDACGQDGRIASFVLSGTVAAQAGWRISGGAEVGMSVNALRGIYPGARRSGGELVLVETPSPIGADGTVSVMTAYVAGGRAWAFRFYVGAAGE